MKTSFYVFVLVAVVSSPPTFIGLGAGLALKKQILGGLINQKLGIIKGAQNQEQTATTTTETTIINDGGGYNQDYKRPPPPPSPPPYQQCDVCDRGRISIIETETYIEESRPTTTTLTYISTETLTTTETSTSTKTSTSTETSTTSTTTTSTRTRTTTLTRTGTVSVTQTTLSTSTLTDMYNTPTPVTTNAPNPNMTPGILISPSATSTDLSVYASSSGSITAATDAIEVLSHATLPKFSVSLSIASLFLVFALL